MLESSADVLMCHKYSSEVELFEFDKVSYMQDLKADFDWLSGR